MSIKVTKRQLQVLQIIQQNIEETGFPPTRAEIAKALNVRSINAAEDHIRALERKGYLSIVSGTSRGIKLTDKAVEDYFPKPTTDLQEYIPDNHVNLPIIGHVAAGSPIEAIENKDNELSVDKSLFDIEPDYLLKVRGESMINIGIFDGDLIAVKKTQQVKNGQVIVARIGHEVTVKRLQKTSNQIQLLPENDDFEPIIVTPDDEFVVEGLAVGLIRTGCL
ncbi:MAG: transcriptional repressor LexA [Gammaproteobacteria bacterium]|nr:transcriptional repressor LexA [Gammaproteobacteria bacterium]